MKKKIIRAAFLYMAAVVFPITAQGETESDLDEMFLNEGKSGQSSALVDSPKWDFFGYLESENFFGLDSDSNSSDTEFIKLEARSRLNAKYGTEFFYGKAVFDVYFYPETALTSIADSGVIDPYEFYMAAGKKFQFKIGKIVHNWGSADAFRITNYLDQRDLRELFMKEEDERYRGSYSANIKYLLGDFAFEGSVVAGLNPVLFPTEGTYWGITPPTMNGVQPVFHPSSAPNGYDDVSVAIRGGGTLGVFDFHLSYFYGTNNSIVMVPHVTMDMMTSEITNIDLYPDYDKVHKIGLDTALNIDKLAARLEGAFTFDQNALYSDETETTFVEQVGTAATIKRNTGTAPYLAFTAGIDYNLWGSNGRVLVEYTNSFYVEDADLFEEEFFSNFLMLTLQDKFFNDNLEVKLMGIMRPQDDPGLMAGGSIAYDFQNGLVLTAGTLIFIGGGDEMLQIYENSDLVYFRARMNF
jgi:hypothetical protein